MKLLLIGHTVKDIISYAGKQTVKPGGLYYSLAGLVNLANEKDEIFLLTSFDEENFELLRRFFSKCNRDFAVIVYKMTTVHLTVFEDKERSEEYENITNKLNIEPVLNSGIKFDGILINMITGFELLPEDVGRLKEKFQSKIYFDVHSLSRGMDKNNRRFFRKIPDANEWLGNVDVVQSNENELLTLTDKENEIEIAKEVLSYGPEFLLKTMGRLGVRAYYTNKDEVASVFLPAVKMHSTNHVGCGDVFGAAFFYSYISGKNLIDSLRFANTAAAVITTYEKFEDYENLKNDVEKLL